MAFEKEMDIAKKAARLAGKKIMEVYGTGDFKVRYKGIDNPVGIADELSNIELCRILHTEFPDYGILTEEHIEEKMLKDIYSSLKDSITGWNKSRYSWILDPLDGTKEFINKSGDFGIHIGLTEDGNPVLGINYYPLTDVMYTAIKGEGAYKTTGDKTERIYVSENYSPETLRAVVSRTNPDSTTTMLIDNMKMPEPLRVGSMGKKVCMVAEGSADFYLLFDSKVKIWDSCSPQVILEEAGGRMTDLYGEMIDYSSNDRIDLDRGVIATNRISHDFIVGISKENLK